MALAACAADVDLEEWVFGQWMKVQHPEYFYDGDGKGVHKEHRGIPKRVLFEGFDEDWRPNAPTVGL
jgi:hypothetical protein